MATISLLLAAIHVDVNLSRSVGGGEFGMPPDGHGADNAGHLDVDQQQQPRFPIEGDEQSRFWLEHQGVQRMNAVHGIVR